METCAKSTLPSTEPGAEHAHRDAGGGVAAHALRAYAALALAVLALVALAPAARAATPRHAHHRHHAVNHGLYRAIPAAMAEGSVPLPPRGAPSHAHRRAVLLPGPNSSTQRAAARPLPRVGAAFCDVAATVPPSRWTRLENTEIDHVTGITLGDRMERGPPRALPSFDSTPQPCVTAAPPEIVSPSIFHRDSERPFGRSRAASLKGTAARPCTPFAGDEA